MAVRVNIAVEDELSEVVLRQLLILVVPRIEVMVSLPFKKRWQQELGKSGYGYIRKQLPAFNAASSKVPHIILLDLDNRECPSAMIQAWLCGQPHSPQMIVRVAVREIEAWLLADQVGMSDYLHVQSKCIPENPERLKDPKRYLVRLAARSRNKEVRESLAPAPGTRSKVGPYFSRGLIVFVRNIWDINEAAKHSESLRRAIAALHQFKPVGT